MKIYIETSVVSFWFDRKPHNRDKRRSVRRFLLLCRKEVHVGYVSRLVRAEIEQSKPGYREQDLRLIGRIGLGDLPYDSRALLDLVQAYRQDPLLRRAPEADLAHIAVYCLSDVNALATMNLRHVANQVILEKVRKVNHGHGIQKEVVVAPPEAFLPPRS